MIFPIILLFISTVTHLLFFGHPGEVVFDEVYFAKFVGDYSTGSYYFDIHPPFGKLLVKFFGDIIGTTYTVDVGTIGNMLPWDIVLLRLLPIFAGILLPLIIYFICRRLNFSALASFAAGSLVILENSLLVQSRFLLLDSLMLLFGFSSILFYLIYIRLEKGKKKTTLIILSALLAACAFGIKWTGLAYPLLIIIAELWRTRAWRRTAILSLIYGAIGLVLYASAFAIHFSLLPRSGAGDPFMTDRFQKTLEGNPYYLDESLKPKGFFGKFIELNLKMYEANQTLKATHSYSSEWYTWPLMLRSVFYWEKRGGEAGSSYIYLLGNPLIYWFGTLSILYLTWRIIKKGLRDNRALFIISGFLVNLLPFALIGRVMFLYHYQAALVFSILALVYFLETEVVEGERQKVTFLLLALCLAAFLFFSPLTYGLRLDDAALQARMWLPGWR